MLLLLANYLQHLMSLQGRAQEMEAYSIVLHPHAFPNFMASCPKKYVLYKVKL